MKFIKTNYGFLVRMEMGERVGEVLKEFIKDNKIESGVFWAIGALKSVKLSFYDLPTKTYLPYEVNISVEVVSMSGNIAWMGGEVIIHCHGVFSDRDGKTTGGHFNDGTVGPTLEIMLFVGVEKIEREFDDLVGLKLLKI
jgi:uncharacterized protein